MMSAPSDSIYNPADVQFNSLTLATDCEPAIVAELDCSDVVLTDAAGAASGFMPGPPGTALFDQSTGAELTIALPNEETFSVTADILYNDNAFVAGNGMDGYGGSYDGVRVHCGASRRSVAVGWSGYRKWMRVSCVWQQRSAGPQFQVAAGACVSALRSGPATDSTRTCACTARTCA